ncbi:MAG: cell division protein ZapB [Acidobacteriota bacterium]
MAIEWLDELETRVREASARLGELTEENRELRARVQELETKLAAAGEGADDGAWEREREEIRGRVERLSQQLEGLL